MRLMMTNEREELMEYVRLLSKLGDSGYQCNREIGDALKRLHNVMMGEDANAGKAKNRKKIVVLEPSIDGMERSKELFKAIVFNPSESRISDMYEVVGDNVEVRIYKVRPENLPALPSGLRGERADYVINNTGMRDLDNVVKTK